MKDHHAIAVQVAERLRRAQQRALAQVEKLFPVGARVRVNGSESRAFTIRVTGHGCAWYDPMTVYGVNTATGKRRQFYAGSSDVASVIELPKAAKKGTAKKS